MFYPVVFRPRYSHVLRAATLGLLAACSGTHPQRDHAAADPQEEGTVSIRNREQGLWGSQEPWKIVEDLQIGSVEGEGPASFGRIVDLAVDGMGRIWVADAQSNNIRVFDAGGGHVRSIGRKGGGPGEFTQIAGMDWHPNGTLWVLDGGNSRYTVLDTAGHLVETHPRAAGVTTTPWPGGFDARGNLYDLDAIPTANGGLAIGVVRHNDRRQPLDTIRLPEAKAEFFELVSPDGRHRDRATVPFTATQTWHLDRNRGEVWLASTADYRFTRQSFTGTPPRVVEREYTPVPITSEDVDQMLEYFQWFTNKGGKIDRSRIPDAKPAFVSMFTDDRDHLWVIPETSAEERPAFDVFDPEGRYLGRIHTASRLYSSPTPVVRGTYMYAVTESESGTAAVVRLRLEGR